MALVRRRALTCQELVELATEYLEGALSPADHELFERHLAGCPACARYVEQLRITVGVLAALRD
jgi:anti-sigma factor RsiW